MENSFVKKIESPEELREILVFLFEKNKSYIENNLYFLPLNSELVVSSTCHESLLKGYLSVWAYFNGNEWDSIFMGCIMKNEKINKKIYSEYIHLANSIRGLFLIRHAIKFAKENNCNYFYLSTSSRNKSFNKIKKIFKKLNFENDLETFALKL